jgi:hypothetical protein
MNVESKLNILGRLANELRDLSNPELMEVKYKSKAENGWFDELNIDRSLASIRDFMLDEESLLGILKTYRLNNVSSLKRIGLILAGNIPLVGFHDILCCFLCDNISMIKLSEKDKYLIPYLIDKLISYDKRAAKYFLFVEKLRDYDAVIATGSDNSARYFEYYFGNGPHIIRKNRSSIGVLNGFESEETLKEFGKDTFYYFGLGCRNISQIWVPTHFDFSKFLKVLEDEKDMINHHKYANNYDYNLALYLMNKANFLQSNNLILKEDRGLVSRIACLHFQYYVDIAEVKEFIGDNNEKIQCIATEMDLGELKTIKPGQTQYPKFTDYADGVDPIKFQLGL